MGTRSRLMVGGSAALWVGLALAACGTTRRTPNGEPAAEGGADGGAAPANSGTGTGGSFTGSSGSFAVSGSSGSATGGAFTAGGASPAPQCIPGAPCACSDSTGTWSCSDADTASDECSCPPADECQAPRGSCFEPCGGDALGFWVLEESCFPGAETGGRCAGGSISGTASLYDVQLEILENEPIQITGGEHLNVHAQVPLSCLGIDTVNRCVDADFYANPLFFGPVIPLECEASACGFCECTGKAWGSRGSGAPWTPGSATLAFGALDVPYCVEGDTLWAGGGRIAGEPKVAHKFRRRSCVGTPIPCAERAPDQCGMAGDCQPGRCVSHGAQAALCEEKTWDEGCNAEPGCQWEPGGCWGTATKACDREYCELVPGCSWGAPQARCGGEQVNCFQFAPEDCKSPGCSMRTCDVPDGWGGIDGAPCNRLTASACTKAAGCTLSGATCTGNTTCAVQTDAAVCAMLECAVYEEPMCGGITTTPCADLSVADCRSQPGCRLEW